MTKAEIDKLYDLLIKKGIREDMAKEILESHQLETTQQVYYAETSGQPMQQFVTALVKEPAVINLMTALANKEERLSELDNHERKDFYSFLTKLDLRQKIYNAEVIIVGCSIVTLLKYFDVVGKESAQTLATVIISASLTDAISSFFKSKDRD